MVSVVLLVVEMLIKVVFVIICIKILIFNDDFMLYSLRLSVVIDVLDM